MEFCWVELCPSGIFFITRPIIVVSTSLALIAMVGTFHARQLRADDLICILNQQMGFLFPVFRESSFYCFAIRLSGSMLIGSCSAFSPSSSVQLFPWKFWSSSLSFSIFDRRSITYLLCSKLSLFFGIRVCWCPGDCNLFDHFRCRRQIIFFSPVG